MTAGSDAFVNAPLSVEADISIAQNCLREATIAAGRDSAGEAKELLAHAKRPHESIVDLMSKLPLKT